MFLKLEDFFFNHLAGKILARVGPIVATWLASGKLGAAIHVDPNEITAVLSSAYHVVYELYKRWRKPA